VVTSTHYLSSPRRAAAAVAGLGIQDQKTALPAENRKVSDMPFSSFPPQKPIIIHQELVVHRLPSITELAENEVTEGLFIAKGLHYAFL